MSSGDSQKLPPNNASSISIALVRLRSRFFLSDPITPFFSSGVLGVSLFAKFSSRGVGVVEVVDVADVSVSMASPTIRPPDLPRVLLSLKVICFDEERYAVRAELILEELCEMFL